MNFKQFLSSYKVLYVPSETIQNHTFKDCDSNIIILTDNATDDIVEYEGHPTISLGNIQQCIHHLSNEDITFQNNHVDTLHHILRQKCPDITQRLEIYGLNLLHLIVYYPGNDIYQPLLNLLEKCPKAAIAIDRQGKTPLHHAVIAFKRYSNINKRCHDLLLDRSPNTVIHRAIQAGLDWHYLHPIVKIKIHSLAFADEESGMLPFMLAAGPTPNNYIQGVDGLLSLNLVYKLLSLNPSVLK